MAVVSTRFDGGVAIVTIDNPPVNMGNHALRSDLVTALAEIAEIDGLEGVVLASAREHFYSGSDIKEFDGPILHPSLPEVIQALDKLEVPIVAALNGLVLGGGLEFALASDVRVAEPKARLGLPETTLGMLPGAGGTVRLPRLVGVAKAIEMISSGKPISANEALDSGLIDELAPAEALVERAIELARTRPKHRAAEQEPPASDPSEAIAKALRKGRARPNVVRAVELVRSGVGKPAVEALAAERAAFDELRVGAEARNLRYLFFAKRAAAKGLAVAAEAAPVTVVGVAGAGTMGSSIAAVCLSAGLDVILVDSSDEALVRAQSVIAERAAAAPRSGRLSLGAGPEALASAEFVIDAVFEDFDVKTELLTTVERAVRPGTVLASNTSYLNLDEIAAALTRPERLAGLHFFNPADRNPLVEVVRTTHSDDQTLATLAALVRRLGKTGIAARVGEGFVANRVYADYRGQAEFLVEDGASPEEVDAAMVDFGFAIGPFAVGDMSGLDIGWARRKRLAPKRDPRQRYVTIPDLLCEAGRLGRKSGTGWYAYPDGASRGVPDPEVARLIAEARATKGITPRTVPSAEIQQRIIGSMLVAAADAVASGVARAASDVDVALTEGFAFPAWLGGPVRYAAAQTPEWLIAALRAVHESDPIGFALAEPASRGETPAAVRAVLEAVVG